MCTTLLYLTSDKWFLWYVTPDVIKFGSQLCMDMEVALGSLANVHEFLEFLDVIDSTQLSSLPDTLREHTYQAID